MADKQKTRPEVEAKRKLKAGAGAVFAQAFAFFTMTLVAAAASLLSEILAMVAIALLVLPSLFAFTHLLVFYTEKGMQPSHRVTLRYHAMYFTPQYRGVYRVLINVLKSLGFYLGGMWLAGIIYGLVSLATNPEFAAALEGFMNAYMALDYEAVFAYMQSDVILRFAEVASIAGMGAGICAFTYFIGNYAMNPFLRYYCAELAPRFATMFYSRYYSLGKKEFHRLYWKHGYGVYIVVPLSYVVPAVICCVIPALTRFGMAISLACMGLCLSIYLPYLLMLASEFWDGHTKLILRAQTELADELYARASALPGVTEEDLTQIKADLDRVKNHSFVDEDEDEEEGQDE